MKQTAVEWLVAELRKYGSPVPRQDEEHAKEIEKQKQGYSEEDMKEAIRFGFDKGFSSNSSNKVKNTLPSEREWFEQFKKK